jgi:hypothetical protein
MSRRDCAPKPGVADAGGYPGSRPRDLTYLEEVVAVRVPANPSLSILRSSRNPGLDLAPDIRFPVSMTLGTNSPTL